MTTKEGIYRWLFGRLSRKHYGPFRINRSVLTQSFVRIGPKKITTVEEERVVSVAQQLEAILVMSETLEGEHPVALAVTNLELMHFVAYVRQLDEMYRKQNTKIEKLESDYRELTERRLRES